MAELWKEQVWEMLLSIFGQFSFEMHGNNNQGVVSCIQKLELSGNRPEINICEQSVYIWYTQSMRERIETRNLIGESYVTLKKVYNISKSLEEGVVRNLVVSDLRAVNIFRLSIASTRQQIIQCLETKNPYKMAGD